jgi:hypothetical protein
MKLLFPLLYLFYLFITLDEIISEVSEGEILRQQGELLRRENKDEESLLKFQGALQEDYKIAKASSWVNIRSVVLNA